jgi:DNA-binding winged helix-turn-helix (wHTH) protein/tetratricopeptide (TPR) repeat protein
VYRFGEYRLDRDRGQLLRGLEPVALTPKALETLGILIERPGEIVGRDEILERVWPGAFVEEAVLTQNVYTLRKALGEGDPGGKYIETVPRRGYRFVAEVAREEAGRSARVRDISSLAVLPFLPLAAGQSADEALGLGMADALIVRLSGLHGQLGVRPTSAVRTFTSRQREPVNIAGTLGVEGMVDGTIQRVADQVRVSVQLLAAGDGNPVWAATFDTPFTDLFTVQDAIAEQVAAALRLELGAGRSLAREEPVDPRAYQAYVTGRYFWNQRTGASLERAVLHFDRAIELESEYARAHAGLADSYALLPLYGNQRPAEALPKAISAAATALSINPRLAEAHTTLAYARFLFEWDWRRAELGFRRAIELNPAYATAHHWLSYYVTARERHEEAIEEIDAALELDPVSLIINADAGLVFYFARRFEEAEQRFRRTLELDPDFAYAHFGLGMTLEALDRSGEAIEVTRRAVRLSDGSSAMLGALGRLLGAAGQTSEAKEVLRQLLEQSEAQYVQAGHVAMVHTGLGDAGSALEWWAKAIEERSRFVPFFDVWPVFDRLRAEPGFGELERRVGLGRGSGQAPRP